MTIEILIFGQKGLAFFSPQCSA